MTKTRVRNANRIDVVGTKKNERLSNNSQTTETLNKEVFKNKVKSDKEDNTQIEKLNLLISSFPNLLVNKFKHSLKDSLTLEKRNNEIVNIFQKLKENERASRIVKNLYLCSALYLDENGLPKKEILKRIKENKDIFEGIIIKAELKAICQVINSDQLEPIITSKTAENKVKIFRNLITDAGIIEIFEKKVITEKAQLIIDLLLELDFCYWQTAGLTVDPLKALREAKKRIENSSKDNPFGCKEFNESKVITNMLKDDIKAARKEKEIDDAKKENTQTKIKSVIEDIKNIVKILTKEDYMNKNKGLEKSFIKDISKISNRAEIV